VLLTQAEFADLVGVTQPMVSKWKARGNLVLGDKGRIDPAASLTALTGILNDDLHAKAIAKLANIDTDSPATRQEPEHPAPESPTQNARQERDHWQAQLSALKYAREAGQVCDTAAVESLACDAINELKAALDQTVQDAAKSIAKDFGIHADKVPTLRRALSLAMVQAPLQAYADRMTKLAATAASQTQGKAATNDQQTMMALPA
jgi:phage terminase Nu1 subunit (DNA packaging protein)